MPIVLPSLGSWLKTNWFFVAAAIVFMGDVAVVQDMREPSPHVIEAAVLADLTLIVPLLYFVCYRSAGRKAIVKAVGLACLGFWLSSRIVPTENHQLISTLWPLRYLGMAALAALEVAILFSLVAIYQSAFGGAAESEVADRLAKTADIPPWAARLMAKEALFWHRVWRAIKRIFSGSGGV